ncbi:hypothetical protein BC833DRAFT_576262 [Globomyces pollinis-pini]|nr:hypothetical protein BC833DRAFT_576262 [Globomyces pollinis-pini]
MIEVDSNSEISTKIGGTDYDTTGANSFRTVQAARDYERLYLELLSDKVKSPADCMLEIAVILFENKMLDLSKVWLTKAAEESTDPIVKFQCSQIDKLIDGDTPETMQYLKEAAESGYDLACYYYGRCFEYGVDDNFGNQLVARDVKKALDIYKTVSMTINDKTPEFKYQHPKSQYRISMILMNGTGGIPIDQNESLQWIYKSAAQGLSDAVFSIGIRVVANEMDITHLNDRLITKNSLDKLLNGYKLMEFGNDRGLDKKNELIFNETIKPLFQKIYRRYLSEDSKLVKYTMNVPRYYLPDAKDVGLEIYRTCLLLSLTPGVSTSAYAPIFGSSAAYGNVDGAYEYARYLQFFPKEIPNHQFDSRTLYAAHYWYAAKQQHLLGLLGFSGLPEANEDIQLSIYAILTHGSSNSFPNPTNTDIEQLESCFERSKENQLLLWHCHPKIPANKDKESRLGGCCMAK